MLTRKKYREAFTIVELLIVIVVIAILAAVSTIAYRNIQGRAQEASLKSDLTQAAKQLAVDKTMTGTFPESASLANGGNGLQAASGTSYRYTRDGSGTAGFCLSAINNGRTYYVTEISVPQEGLCPDHGETGGGTTVACAGYSVGDTGPAGGKIFYKDASVTPAICYEAAPAGWYLATAPNDPQAEWGCFKVAVAGADGTAIGAGRQNTVDIVAANCARYNSSSRLASVIASGYEGGGKTDWYLPSRDELNEMYKQRAVIGGFIALSYWSSSEFSDANAWLYYFSNNSQSNLLKMNQLYVRPVRSFSNN